MILFVLWLFTSSYATQVATMPTPEACAIAGVGLAQGLETAKGPKPFLYRLACIPTFVPVARPREPPAQDRFSF